MMLIWILTAAVLFLTTAYIRERSRHRRLYWLTRQAVHDLRSPLQVFDIVAKNLPENYSELLKSAKNRTQDILCELHKTLEHSEIDSVDLLQIISNLLEEKSATHPVQFFNTLQIPHGKKFLIPVSQFKRAFANILQNAVDAKTKTIHVSGQCGDKSLIVKIDDQGCGFDPQDLNLILNHKKPRHRLNGEGLGLDQVRGALKKMGGTFKIDSISNHGTEVTLEIPHLTTFAAD